MGRERRRRGREAGGGVGEREGERGGRERKREEENRNTGIGNRKPIPGDHHGKGPASRERDQLHSSKNLCLATAPRVREACSGSSAQRGVSHQRHCILVTLDSMLLVTIQIWVSPL